MSNVSTVGTFMRGDLEAKTVKLGIIKTLRFGHMERKNSNCF
jgi:hypothetical protein